MGKIDKYFNEKEYNDLRAEAQESVNRVMDGIEALREEGISTDKETLKKLTSSPDALKNFLRDSANNQIGKGYVAPAEKSRIFEVYSCLLARIEKRFELMRVSLPQVPIVFEKDSITVDWDQLDKKAKEAATYQLDTEGLNAWWDKVENIKKALDDLRAYEIENNLPDFEKDGIHYTDGEFFLSPKLHDFLIYGGKRETFDKAARGYFIKK
ncbi:MAG: hypothetical protein VB024_12085 [Dysgonamonadaceae bacterium]|nr:hypothetical protein [Dysgonamonadaceae bacterium]